MKIRIDIEEKTYQAIQEKLERYDRLLAIAEAMAAELAPFENDDGPLRMELTANEMAELVRMQNVFDEKPDGLSACAADELSECVSLSTAQSILQKLEEFLEAQNEYHPVDFSRVLDFEKFKLGFK